MASALSGVLATLIGMVSVALHAWRTPGDDNAVWLAADQEMRDIAAPLSRIVARRLPEGLGSADVGDGVELATATAAYAGRGIMEEVAYRRARRPTPATSVTPTQEPASQVDEPEAPAPGPWPPNGVNPLETMGRG